jgi:thioredoxin-dependent peroxiredoxin
MKLRVGQFAPDFDVLDIYGRRVSLMSYLGRSVLLSFHRAAVCPLCNLRMWHMIRRYPAYQRAGLEVVAFFESTPERARFYLDRQQAPFPIIGDHTSGVYGDYRLGSSLPAFAWAFLMRRGMFRDAARLKIGGSTMETFNQSGGRVGRLPGDFLVGPDGRIRLAYYGRDPGDFMLFSDLERAAFGAPLPDAAIGAPLGARY